MSLKPRVFDIWHRSCNFQEHLPRPAAGAVNVNLQNLRRRVDKALLDMRLICANLGTAIDRVQRHQLDLRAFADAVRSGKDAPGDLETLKKK